jgi:hypothetical protein
MNDRISQILAQMVAPEEDLRIAVHEQESKMFFQIKGKRVEFESSVKAAHRKLKQNFFRWLITNRPQNLITGPIISAMIVPLMMLDLCVSFYQWACFPIYGVKKVKRSDYLVFDRRHLAYLNFIKKFHCTYCEYGDGLMSYMTEILARTPATTGFWTTVTPPTVKPGWRNFASPSAKTNNLQANLLHEGLRASICRSTSWGQVSTLQTQSVRRLRQAARAVAPQQAACLP